MQTPVHPDLPPEALVLDPFQTPGFRLLQAPPPLWRAIPAARAHAFAQGGEVLALPRFPRAIEVATLPVLLADLRFQGPWVTQGARHLLPGTLGKQLLDDYAHGLPGNDDRLIEHFAAAQERPRHLAEHLDDLAPGTPFVLPCAGPRLVEGLAALCLVEQTGLRGPIYLHFPEGDPAIPRFRAFIETLFPELAPRTILDHSPAQHSEAVLPYSFATSLYQLPAPAWDEIEREFPPSEGWEGRRASRSSHAVLAAHLVDSCLFDLRQRGVQATRVPSPLPRRFWLAEAAFPGDAALHEMLHLFGFIEVQAETLTPAEQIALMAGAEIVIGASPLLLFASPDCTVIELGDPDPWAERWPQAAVSGCQHLVVLLDKTEGLTRLGLARLMSLVVTLLDKIPEFTSPEEVRILGRQLMELGDIPRASALFETHATLAEAHPGLALAMADLAEQRGETANVLAALYMAYRADPSDWAVLIRMLWCAREMNQPELVTTLLATLHDGFPDRFEAFARARPWVADHFSPDPEA